MICEFCGEERIFDLIDCWLDERAWLFETCCEEYHQTLLDDLEEAADMKPHKRMKFLAPLIELFAGYGIDLRQAYRSENEMAFRLDYGLHIDAIEWSDAREFIAQHHQHNASPRGWRWGHAVKNGDTLIGVATVGRPVARMIDPKTTVEVTRNCIDLSLDKELRFHGCSQLYIAAENEARSRGFEKIITYTLEDEPATALKELGWNPEAKTRAESWNRKSRERADVAPAGRKIRWSKYLNPNNQTGAAA